MRGNDGGKPPSAPLGDSASEEIKPSSNSAVLLFQFDLYELNPQSYELRRKGIRLRVAPSPMELLLLLIERRDTLVSRKEIAERLWSEPDMVDVDQGINTAIRRIREVLRDDPSRPRFIETVVGKGYRFIAEVKELRADRTLPTISASQGGPAEQESFELKSGSVESSGTSDRREPLLTQPRRLHKRWIFATVVALSLVLWSSYSKWRAHKEKMAEYSSSFLQVTTDDSEQRVTAAAISPDGRWIAYGNINGISLRLLQNGQTIALNAPENFRTDRIAWFPDQTKILISGFETKLASPQIWVVYVTGGPPQLFHKSARNGLPSPDGTRIIFTTNGDREIWTAGTNGEGSHPLIVDRSSKVFSAIFWSGDGKRVSYLRTRDTLGSEDYESADAGSGNLLALEKNVRFESACALADGRVFFLGGPAADLRNPRTLWEVDTKPSDGGFISAPKRIASVDQARVIGLTSSEQGDKLSVVIERGKPHVFMGTLQEPGPNLVDVHRLTYDTRTDYPHGWLLDNQTVIFESDRSGYFRLYQQRLQDREPREINTGTGPAVLPQITPDGKWILYAMKPDVLPSAKDRLFRIPVGGGTPEEVPLSGHLDEFECPLRRGTCVLRETVGKRAVVYSALDPITGKGREMARTPWRPPILGDWCISPDGSAVAVTSHDVGDPRIRIIPLGATPTKTERELPVVAFGTLEAISWSADGKGWYVAADAKSRTTLLFVDQQGKSHALRDTTLGSWGVPSPDGKRLAFVDQSTDSNVWMWQIAKQP